MLFLQYDKFELDKQYDQRAWAPNAAEVIRRYTQRSEEVRVTLGERPALPLRLSMFLSTEELGAC